MQQQNIQSTCPNCGYCPHCGRGWHLQPYLQPYPLYPAYPPSWPNVGQITWGNVQMTLGNT